MLATRHETEALGARAALVDAEACARALRVGRAPERDAAMQIRAGRSDRAGAIRVAVPAVVAHPRGAATVRAAALIRRAAGCRAAWLALRSEVAVHGVLEAHLAGAAVGVDRTGALFAHRDSATAFRGRTGLAHALVAAVTSGLSRRARASRGLCARSAAGLDGTIASRWRGWRGRRAPARAEHDREHEVAHAISYRVQLRFATVTELQHGHHRGFL